MSGGAALLDEVLLQRLEAAGRAQGAPIAGSLRAGISEREIDALTQPLGLRLPTEARRWWTWHDGATAPAPPAPAPSRLIGPGLAFLPLRDAIELYETERAMFTSEPAVAELRPANFFPISYSAGPMSCDCSVEPGAPSPIFHVHSHDYDIDGVRKPKAGSLGEVVSWWIDALSDGTWTWDQADGRWIRHVEHAAPERVASGLI